MKKFYYLSAILALGMMFSCQKPEIGVDEQFASDLEIEATLADASETRTQFIETANGYKVAWSADDKISVFSSDETVAEFTLSRGAGEPNGSFKLTGGEVEFGTQDSEGNDYALVGVYPYSQTTTVAKNGESYVINTEIPAIQEYAVNSVGNNAAPMVSVSPEQSLKDFRFKNVGSFVIVPLKGNALISTATLESRSGRKIAGATAVTVSAENDWQPVVNVTENGVSKVQVVCPEGVQLDSEVATNFFFVLAPGTYDAKDITVKFYDTVGNYYEYIFPSQFTLTRSKSAKLQEKEFVINGTALLDLYVRAEAFADMEASRIIPSLNGVDIISWVKNIAEMEDPKAVIEEAIGYITLKNYKAAYELLEGFPGFTQEVINFHAKGVHTLKVDYDGMDYLESFLDDIDKIHDVASLLEFIARFEGIYKASGLQAKLNEAANGFGDVISTLLDNTAIWGDNAKEMIKSIFKGSYLEGTVNWILSLVDTSKLTPYIKAWLNTTIEEITSMSLTQMLEKAASGDGITGKFLNYIFEQDLDNLKAMLHEIVAGIENASKDEIVAGNIALKNSAISAAKINAIIEARVIAQASVESEFNLLNETNMKELYDGPWGFFQKVLNSYQCVEAFDKLGIIEVYNVLVDLSKAVEEMIAYDKGDLIYTPAEFEDYVENEHWWVIGADQLF